MPLSRLPARARVSRENLTFKSLLVISALLLGTLVVAELEFFISAPGHSLSETETAIRLVVR